jgi:hypothetical protein
MIRSSWSIALAAAACGSSSGSHDAGGPPGGGGGTAHGASVLELHAGPSRAGAYADAAFTPAAAASLHLDTAFTAKYTGAAFAQPLYLDRGGAAQTDLVIAATEANQVTAFDPTGAMVWRVELGAPQPMPNAAEGANCGNINPLGITGTPVIDAATGTLYLDAMIRDGNAAHHRIFALSVDDGATRSGWPVDVATALKGTATAFAPAPQNQRGGLTLLGGRLYVPYGGHSGDCGNYHGWVVAVPVDQPSACSPCSATATARPGARARRRSGSARAPRSRAAPPITGRRPAGRASTRATPTSPARRCRSICPARRRRRCSSCSARTATSTCCRAATSARWPRRSHSCTPRAA